MELRKEIQKILNNNTINENRVDRLEKLTKEYSLIQRSEMIEMIKLLVDRMEENDLGQFSAVKRAKELINKATNI